MIRPNAHNEDMSPRPTLILGLGNILLSDEGIGVHLVEQLAHCGLPDKVELVDGGTFGMDLLDTIAGRDHVIVIDCADIDGPPGAIEQIPLERLVKVSAGKLSLHEFGLVELLHTARILDCLPDKLTILGVKPAVVKSGTQLSPQVAAQVPRLLQRIIEIAV
jgi:hydrogenase maturation protease